MPGRDRTGPMGYGPRTGRGAGLCGRSKVKGQKEQGRDRGQGGGQSKVRGRGFGRGRGLVW